MDEVIIDKFIQEYRLENHINPFRKDEEFIDYIKDGIDEINEVCGAVIDYEKDRVARRLLKNYVLYADYKKLAEFKQLYGGDFDALQRKYFIISNKNTNI